MWAAQWRNRTGILVVDLTSTSTVSKMCIVEDLGPYETMQKRFITFSYLIVPRRMSATLRKIISNKWGMQYFSDQTIRTTFCAHVKLSLWVTCVLFSVRPIEGIKKEASALTALSMKCFKMYYICLWNEKSTVKLEPKCSVLAYPVVDNLVLHVGDQRDLEMNCSFTRQLSWQHKIS